MAVKKFPNLSAELARHGMTQEDMASSISRPPETVSRWMSGKNAMPIGECFRIKEMVFPDLSVDYLFASEPISTVR